MIPRAHITAWRSRAPWSSDAQIEQDLVVCRALVEIYSKSRDNDRGMGNLRDGVA